LQRIILLALLIAFSSASSALFISEPKNPVPILKQLFSLAEIPSKTELTHINGDVIPVWDITQNDGSKAYAFETDDIAPIPAYSGETVNMLVSFDENGNFINTTVLEHHEPILLVGIPESSLTQFTDQYDNLKLQDRIKVGGNTSEGHVHIDGISGATVTVMVMNVAILKAARKVAEAIGIIDVDESRVAMSSIKTEVFKPASWIDLTGDGSIRKLLLTQGAIDDAFVGTEAENQVAETDRNNQFAEVYFTQLNIPTVGRNLLGESEYNWLMEQLQPGEHAIGIFSNGYSHKGSGFVRGGIFDRIQILQGNDAISFRDVDFNRLSDLYIEGVPEFSEMSLFIIREHFTFNPGQPWQFEFLVRRQIGAIDSIFTSFIADYLVLDKYVDTPIIAEPLPLWREIWSEKSVQVILLVTGLFILLLILFFQDILVRYPKVMNHIRHWYLIYTVGFIGFYCAGQLSVVNVFTFLQALLSNFNWETFLLDPAIFILWAAAAFFGILWGRGVYCGWLCPFGALQELINYAARIVKIPQFELPYVIHERLWAIKYIILLILFGISLQSLALAEQYAEVEPFKTTFLLKFSREWGYVLWAGILLASNLFTRKVFCRYLCPLGAALSMPTNLALFDWLKRRKECGQPCKTCANECEIQAIEPSGKINLRECHYCLDCQVTYFDDDKCPPLILKKKNKEKKQKIAAQISAVQL